MSSTPGTKNMARIGTIGAAFLTVTVALIWLQPDGEQSTDAFLLDDGDAVSRAQTDILTIGRENADSAILDGILNDSDTGSAPRTSAAQANPDARTMDKATADVLASLGATNTPIAAAAETDVLRNMTSNVLSGLIGTSGSDTTAATSMEQLVVQALNQGQSDSYIEAMINEAADAGSINVPAALRTNEGRVDTNTLLAELVRKSSPESFEAPALLTSGDGVEVRVVQRAGETRQYNFYTVQTGDSLGAIAHRFYGDAALYTTIFEANRQFISRPDRIRVGQRLSIPMPTASG